MSTSYLAEVKAGGIVNTGMDYPARFIFTSSDYDQRHFGSSMSTMSRHAATPS
jgi:hypothetical protein